MFSGIVTHKGKVAALEIGNEDWRIDIETDMEYARCKLGDSIACDGICLTVAAREQVEKKGVRFTVQAGTTTRARTTLAEWQVGKALNLERSLCLGDSLDGHLVMGHVDAWASVCRRKERENEIQFDFLYPTAEVAGIVAAQEIRACCAARGSVALNGVSLTVSAVRAEGFSVAVIPYTAEKTTLGLLGEGDRVNLEIDVLARYVGRRLALTGSEQGGWVGASGGEGRER